MSESPSYSLVASASILSTCLTLPLDYVKVQQQLLAAGHKVDIVRSAPLAREAVSIGGARYLYKGADAAAGRALVYSLVRSNIYSSLFLAEANRDMYGSVPIWLRTSYQMFACAVGAFLANPFDMALLRMQADNLLPDVEKRNYSNVSAAMTQIAKEEGFAGLLTGASANMGKWAMFTFGAMSTYDQMNEWIARLIGDVVGVKTTAATFAGLVGAAFALPFDNVKTKMQMRPGIYKSFSDCLLRSWGHEGFFGFYVGFWPYVVRFSLSFYITVSFIDYMRSK